MGSALSGIKVLDLTRVLAGPLCTMTLGDLGAEVIKVEAPGGSDDTRYWGPPFQNGTSGYYLCANRNKKSLTVNLKTEKGKEIIKKLAMESDVVIHNFKSGTMERLGLSYDVISELNPRAVYCSITGFGETGPYKELAGYDFIIQAMCGFMSITGSEESGPQKAGVAITDILTGLNACIAIQAALLERSRSGKGQRIDVSLFDSGVASLVNISSNYLMSGTIPRPLGNQHANIVPYQTFDTSDGKMVIAVGNNHQFEKLCSLMGLAQLSSDERFHNNSDRVKNREELVGILQNTLRKNATRHWQNLCNENGIPSGPIQNIEEVFQNPQIAARNMIVEMEHPEAGQVKLVGTPLKLSRTPVRMKYHPPSPGEHSHEILDRLGYSKEEMKELAKHHII
jgi:crotonobetainyl-CoA:carnitine CoA-transferase CaiB-like acyl-CoA transferase